MKKYLVLLLFTISVFSQDIDVGSIEGNRQGYTVLGKSYLDLRNPANASGLIDSIGFYIHNPCTADTLFFALLTPIGSDQYTTTSYDTLIVTGTALDYKGFRAPGDFDVFEVDSGNIFAFCGAATNGVLLRWNGDQGGTRTVEAGNQCLGGTVTLNDTKIADQSFSYELFGSTTYFIDADKGDDDSTGTRTDRPFLTILKATALADTMKMSLRTDGTWRETLTPGVSGTAKHPITYTCYDSATGLTGTDAPGDRPIIDSTGVVIDFNGQSYIVLENLEIRNGLTQLNLGTNNIIRYCEFDSADANALLLDGNTNSVYYNLFLNATTDAIEVDSLSNTIYNNVIYGNGNGIDVDTTVTIQNNIIWTSGTSDITIAADVTVAGGHNIFEDAAKAGDGTYSGTSLWATDPLFTDAANADFTLDNSSPAIDAGTDVGLTVDYIGTVVPSPPGTNPDIGAYEYNQSVGYEKRFKRFLDFLKFKRD